MPIYEYRCKDCGEHLEVVQAFTDDPLTECPNCGGALRKVFGNIGITFKGSGFYKNDSRSAARKSAATTAEKSETKSDSKSDSKTETKSDTKSDTKKDSPSTKSSDVKSA